MSRLVARVRLARARRAAYRADRALRRASAAAVRGRAA